MTALKQLQEFGVRLQTGESVLFELMNNYKVPEFKQILSILKEHGSSNQKGLYIWFLTSFINYNKRLWYFIIIFYMQ